MFKVVILLTGALGVQGQTWMEPTDALITRQSFDTLAACNTAVYNVAQNQKAKIVQSGELVSMKLKNQVAFCAKTDAK